MIETGFIVFLSLMVMVFRLKRTKVLWLFGHPLWLELPMGFLAYALHFGTFSGMMAAAVAVIMVYVFTQCGRWALGYIKDGKYYKGFFT